VALMAGLWDTLKRETPSAPRSIANDDIQETIDPVRGAPVRFQRTEGLKFTPVESREHLDIDNSDDDESKSARAVVVDPNLDLVTEDVTSYTIVVEMPPDEPVAVPASGCTDGRSKMARAIKQQAGIDESKGGRPRKYATNAERQAAYRLREAIAALPPLQHMHKKRK
jgi:hypothetical protein